MEELKKLSGKKFVKLTESGDHAILSILKFAKSLGKERVILQDQGGWLTYRDYAKKAGLQFVEMKTDYGVIILDELKKHLDEKSVLLVNSLSGYIAEQPMQEIYDLCTEKVLVVNDISGSIGTELAKIGDIVLCSFGKDKPINCHYGGFIGYDNEAWSFEGEFDEKQRGELERHVGMLAERRKKLLSIAEKIKKTLSEHDIIHPNRNGLNVAIKYKDELEKKRLTDYADSLGVPYALCPRYIRVNAQAVCFEVKRL